MNIPVSVLQKVRFGFTLSLRVIVSSSWFVFVCAKYSLSDAGGHFRVAIVRWPICKFF